MLFVGTSATFLIYLVYTSPSARTNEKPGAKKNNGNITSGDVIEELRAEVLALVPVIQLGQTAGSTHNTQASPITPPPQPQRTNKLPCP